MLRHLYGLDYAKDIDDTDKVDIPKMVFDAQIYATADKYDIPSLKDLVIANFDKKLKTRQAATDFSLSIKVIYESTLPTDRGLRDIAVRLAVENLKARFEKNEVFQKAMSEVAEFGKDLVRELSNRLEAQPKVNRYECPNCAGRWNTTEAIHSSRNYYCYLCGKKASSSLWTAQT
jgi:hypothetical protein